MWTGGKLCPCGLDTAVSCDVCFDLGNGADFVPNAEVIDEMNIVGKKLLLICKNYFRKGLFFNITGIINCLKKTACREGT